MGNWYLVVSYTCRRCEASWCGPVYGPYDNETYTTRHTLDIRAWLRAMHLSVGLRYQLRSGIDP